MKPNRWPRSLALVRAALAAAALAPGCAKHVSVNAQPCPCADGFVCCPSGICATATDACDQATSALSTQARGQWSGYVENYSGLASGSDTLKLAFDVADDGTLTGRVTLGDAAPPAPATDGTQIWPPGLSADDAEFAAGKPIEGFVYTAREIRWEARRLRFAIALTEPWKPWCELQRPYDWDDPALQPPSVTNNDDAGPLTDAGGVGVPPDADDAGPSPDAGAEPTSTGTGGHTPDWHCVRHDTDNVGIMWLCLASGYPCTCDATACTAAGLDPDDVRTQAREMTFDLVLTGDAGDGSLAFEDVTNNVRLVRASR
jgi:hypothetical protein